MVDYVHPGGKLIEEGPASLTDAELLAILVSTGIPGKSALQIAEDTLSMFGSLKGMCNQPLERFLQIKGLSDVKIVRIAAAYELAYRLVGLREKGAK
jgi:DNA repair protein RadC